MSEIELLDAFYCFDSCRNMVNKLMEALRNTDPGAKFLALEGLFRIEVDVKRYQFPGDVLQQVKNFLREWRGESMLRDAYSSGLPLYLRSLRIFKTLGVPLFIDDYGEKMPLSSYEQEIIDVQIDGNTPIFHVTHEDEAAKICKEERFEPSDNKNIIEGTWFGLDNPTDSSSVYGSYSFETTLSQLDGVTGLHQGEVVSYKNEVNVILYAADDTTFSCNKLKKPTDEAVMKINDRAYVKVSIFVPATFLPGTPVSSPTRVPHGPFCVRQMRSRNGWQCKE